MNPNLQDNQLSDTDQKTSRSARPRRVEKNAARPKSSMSQVALSDDSGNGNGLKSGAEKQTLQKKPLDRPLPPAEQKLPASFRGRVRPRKDAGPPSVQLLCRRMAFVYQRLSTTEQKKNSRYSLERQDDLERMAREDGYPEELVYVERRDLGISGTKGQEEREGLGYLVQLIEQDKVESVYVIEISRISRDQTLITGLQFGELCRAHGVIIVTPTMRLNLQDEMHMRMYRYEIDRAAEELKSLRFRMQGAKDMKARHGYAVGGVVPTGYIIDMEEKSKDGSLNPNFQKFKIYPPHAKVVRTLFRMMAQPGARDAHFPGEFHAGRGDESLSLRLSQLHRAQATRCGSAPARSPRCCATRNGSPVPFSTATTFIRSAWGSATSTSPASITKGWPATGWANARRPSRRGWNERGRANGPVLRGRIFNAMGI